MPSDEKQDSKMRGKINFCTIYHRRQNAENAERLNYDVKLNARVLLPGNMPTFEVKEKNQDEI